MLNRLLPMACMALLASCKTAAPMPAPVVPEPVLTPEQLAERQELDQDRLFARSFQDAIRYPMRALSGAHWVGKFEYVFTIDRNNRLVSCALGPTTRAETQALSYNPELARAMAPLCWTIVLAELAARRFGDKAQATIVAPIVVNLEQEAGSMAFYARSQARKDYLRQQLMAMESFDSIGSASITTLSDAQGVLQSCSVKLEPHRYRPAAFKQDDALQARLTERCQRLDLRQVPGFKVSRQSPVTQTVTLSYSPWVNGVPYTVQ